MVAARKQEKKLLSGERDNFSEKKSQLSEKIRISGKRNRKKKTRRKTLKA